MTTILTNLKSLAQPSEREFGSRAGAVASVHAEISPGVFVHVSLSQDGLLFRQAETRIAVPLVELVALASSHAKPLEASPGVHDSHFLSK